jgi:hypothetical protein
LNRFEVVRHRNRSPSFEISNCTFADLGFGEAVRVVDMNDSNSWAEFAGLFCDTRQALADHGRAKSELKGLMPEDAKEAIGHGIRAKRSKSGSVSFDLVEREAGMHRSSENVAAIAAALARPRLSFPIPKS